MNLEEWKESGLQLIKALRVRGEEESFRRLLSDLYPDKAHFIYELFQNAEDAKAESCQFTLTEADLKFEHNGTRLFSEKDVKSITSFGNSTKRDDPTSIGKFGVGFKAVFAYTNSPEVHSGDFHFRIHDLVVPEAVEPCQIGKRATKFIFPFNHPNKLATQAEVEIVKGLLKLCDNTLLFLMNIRKVEYLLPDGSLGSLERIDQKNGFIEIRSSHPDGKETVSHWLRFEKDVEVTDEDGLKICRIAIAYSLAEEERKKKQSKWKIVPLEHGEVSIYFPAEKETSNLRFHIHAPFASTVARDSVRDCKANQELRSHLAKLAVESLTNIRDAGMLDVSFLAVLPNPADNLPEFYEPIREAIVEAFCKQDLTPTRSGEHRSAGALYRGPVKIADVLEDKGLSSLTKFPVPLWAANAPQANQREDQFIQSLGIDVWGWGELVSIFEQPHPLTDEDNEEAENAAHRKRIETFIREISDADLMRLYALLGEAVDAHDESVDINDLCIVRVTSNGVDRHVAPKEAYLPSEAETSSPSDVFFVKPEVYSIGRSDSQKKYAKSFLGEIGVRPYDEKAAVEKTLKEHYSETNFKPSMNDLKSFIALLEKETYKANIFTSYRIIECQDGTWRKPCQTFLDQPFKDTGLSAYYDALGEMVKSFSLSDSYKSCGISSQRLAKFAEAVGVQTELKITETNCKKNPQWPYLSSAPGSVRTWTSVNCDYEIVGLEKIFDGTTFENLPLEPSLAISRLIWKRMYSLPSYKDYLRATFSNNQSNSARYADSILIHQLTKFPWVPQVYGVDSVDFVRPMDAVQRLLPQNQGFQFDPGWGWLKAIQFGEEEVKKSDVYRQKQTAAEELGFDSAEEVDKWKKIRDSGISPDEIIAQYAQRPQIAQPEDSVRDPVIRQKKVLANTADAPSNESVMLERSIQKGISEVAAQAKAYLRTKYMNADKHLVCQCCHEEMPFKLRSNEYYFEAVQCIGDKEMRHYQNRLALCPTCAAMYQYARETHDAEIRRCIVEHEADDKAPFIEIPVRLAGRELTLRFVGTHWFDLKTVLTA